MTASDTPPPLTDGELAHARRRQSDPLAQTSLIEARLLAEVDRLRSMKCATCGKRIGYINHKGHLLGWGCADGEECAENAMAAEVDRLRAELADTRTESARLYRSLQQTAAAVEADRDALAAELAAVDELHQPYDTPDDPHASRRCKGCIAGYDPRTGDLVHCAWPCPTKRARAALGETGGTENG